MTIEEAYKLGIPHSFKCGNNTITVEIKDIIGADYGRFIDAKNLIELAVKLRLDNEEVELNKNQILTSYYHELMYCWDFYYDCSYSEAHAQSMANLMLEYELSKVV